MYAAPPASRYGSAIAAAIVTALVGWALVIGLAGATIRDKLPAALSTFIVTPPSPPLEKTIPRPKVSKRAEGRAAPPNLRSKATPVVAPTPVVPPPAPPPIVAAPKPFQGDQVTQGAARVAGPGTGAGGIGNGTGAGDWGNGDGDGGDEIPPRWRKGRLKDSDYPSGAGESGIGGTVSVKFLVWTDGRVRDCQITHSSGSRLLDATTCRLITDRYRYDPSRDAAGRPVPAWIIEDHEWVVRGGYRE